MLEEKGMAKREVTQHATVVAGRRCETMRVGVRLLRCQQNGIEMGVEVFSEAKEKNAGRLPKSQS